MDMEPAAPLLRRSSTEAEERFAAGTPRRALLLSGGFEGLIGAHRHGPVRGESSGDG